MQGKKAGRPLDHDVARGGKRLADEGDAADRPVRVAGKTADEGPHPLGPGARLAGAAPGHDQPDRPVGVLRQLHEMGAERPARVDELKAAARQPPQDARIRPFVAISLTTARNLLNEIVRVGERIDRIGRMNVLVSSRRHLLGQALGESGQLRRRANVALSVAVAAERIRRRRMSDPYDGLQRKTARRGAWAVSMSVAVFGSGALVERSQPHFVSVRLV